MTCEEFLRLIDEDRLEEHPEAAAHVEECASCRAALERWRVTRMAFAAMRDEPAPPFLHTRVMAHVQGAPPERRSLFAWIPTLRPTWATTALVLVLGFALGGVSVWRWRSVPEHLAAAPEPAREAVARKAERTDRPASETKPKGAVPAPPPSPASPFPAIEQMPANQAPERSDRRSDFDKSLDRAGAARPEKESRSQAAHPAGPSGEGQMQSGGAPAPSMFRESPGAASSESAQQPSEPQPATRELAPAPSDEESSRVVCTLKSLDEGRIVVLQLPVGAAPPPAAAWSIVVGSEGSSTVLDASGARLARPNPELLGILASQRLSPGRYLLKRVG